MSSTEQTRSRRYVCSHDLIVQIGKSRFRATLKNLSGSGGYLESDNDFSNTEEILLLIRLQTEEQRMFFNVAGTVVWSREEDGKYRSGIRWLRVSTEESVEYLRFFVTEFLHGTTGRIQVERDPLDSERKTFVFDFAAPGEIEAYLRRHTPSEKEITPQEISAPTSLETAISPQAPMEVDFKKSIVSSNQHPSSHPEDDKKHDRVRLNGISVTKNDRVLPDPPSEPRESRVPFAMGAGTPNQPSSEEQERTASPAKENSSTHLSRASIETHQHLQTFADDTNSNDGIPVVVRTTPLEREVAVESASDLATCRRSHERFKLTNLEISLVHRGFETPLRVVDISRSGAAVTSLEHVPGIEEGVTLKIRSQSSRRPTRFNAKIVRMGLQRGNSKQFAVRFDRPSHRGHQIEQNRTLDEILTWT